MSVVIRNADGSPTKLDLAEAAMAQMPRVESPLEHGFFAGFYIRQIRMPAGQWVASKVHKTRHPYWITEGSLAVYDEAKNLIEKIVAPSVGITEPGTRRLLYIETETVWTTFHHVGEETDLAAIEQIVIEPYTNPILGITHAEMQNADPALLHENAR